MESASAWIVNLNPKALREHYDVVEQEEIYHKISEILGISYDTVLTRSKMNSNSVKLTTKADKEQKDRLNAYFINSLTFKCNDSIIKRKWGLRT